MKIFVSYRRTDTPDVSGRIYDSLAEHFGDETIFKDVDDIPLGVHFARFLQGVIQRCSVMLVVIGPDWVDVTDDRGRRRLDQPEDFVRIEVATALERGIPVIPLLVRGASIPRQSELPEDLASLSYHNGIRIRPDPDFHRDMARLNRQLEQHVTPLSETGISSIPTPKADKRAEQGRVTKPQEQERSWISRWWVLVLVGLLGNGVAYWSWALGVAIRDTLYSSAWWDQVLAVAPVMGIHIIAGVVVRRLLYRQVPKSGPWIVANVVAWVVVDLVVLVLWCLWA